MLVRPESMPLSFKIHDTNQKLLSDPEATDTSLVAYAVPNQLKKEKRFTDMGNACPVSCRASVVRLTFMKLLGTGLLAAFMAGSVRSDLAYSCALAGGVNAVAAFHYGAICLCLEI